MLAQRIATAPGVDKVIIAESPQPRFDVYVPIMSLPLILDMPEDILSGNIPMPPAGGRQVRLGFCWSPARARASTPDRSCPITKMIKLFAILGIVSFGLQMSEREEDLKAEGRDALMPDIGGHTKRVLLHGWSRSENMY